MKPKLLSSAAFCLVLYFSLLGAPAAEGLRPYVLAWQGEAALETVVENSKRSMKALGFELMGHYQPMRDTHILVVTAPLLRKMAVAEKNAIFLATQSVAIRRVAGEVRVSYQNPDYYRRAYRVEADMAPLRQAFQASLGRVREYGSENGLSLKRLQHFQYGYGMESFEDQLQLASFADQETAVQAIEAGFGRHAGFLERIYRLDLPEAGANVFGVSMLVGKGADAELHEVFGGGDFSHASQLPYKLVVSMGSVWALHPRFQLALNFPDTRMVGAHRSAVWRQVPEEIHLMLKRLASE